jgi:hypothetical protein
MCPTHITSERMCSSVRKCSWDPAPAAAAAAAGALLTALMVVVVAVFLLTSSPCWPSCCQLMLPNSCQDAVLLSSVFVSSYMCVSSSSSICKDIRFSEWGCEFIKKSESRTICWCCAGPSATAPSAAPTTSSCSARCHRQGLVGCGRQGLGAAAWGRRPHSSLRRA